MTRLRTSCLAAVALVAAAALLLVLTNGNTGPLEHTSPATAPDPELDSAAPPPAPSPARQPVAPHAAEPPAAPHRPSATARRGLILLRHDGTPLPDADVGLVRAGESKPAWHGTTADDGFFPLQPGLLRTASHVVIRFAPTFCMTIEPHLLPPVSPPHEVFAPRTARIEVAVTGLPEDRSASIWCGSRYRHVRDARMPDSAWRLAFTPVLELVHGSETLPLPLPDLPLGFEVRASARDGGVVPRSFVQPFTTDRLEFRWYPRDPDGIDVGVRLLDSHTGRVADLRAWAVLTIGSSSHTRNFTGELPPQQGFRIRPGRAEAELVVRSARGDVWRESPDLAALRHRSTIDLIVPDDPPGVCFRPPPWPIARIYALSTDGTVRGIPRAQSDPRAPTTWTPTAAGMRFVGLPPDWQELWLLHTGGAAAVIRNGTPGTTELDPIGTETLTMADVLRHATGRSGPILVHFETRIPGHAIDHWIRLDTARVSTTADFAWSKLALPGVPGRIRLHAGGDDTVIAEW